MGTSRHDDHSLISICATVRVYVVCESLLVLRVATVRLSSSAMQMSERIEQRWTAATMVGLLLLLAMSVSAQQPQPPLWNDAVGDNNNLMAMFAPPPQQQQAAVPSVLQQWQQQQAMGGQQAAAAPAATDAGAALIAQLAALLQGAGVAQQQPQQQQQGYPMQMQMQQAPMQVQPQRHRRQVARNLYGSRRPTAPVADTSLIATASPATPAAAPAVDTILPLARGGGYGFTQPPADVAARRQARRPKPVDQLDVLGRISRHAAPGAKRARRQRNHWVNLEHQFKHAPRRAVPRKQRKQKRFPLRRTRKPKRVAVDSAAVKQVLQANPFLAKLQAQQTQKLKQKAASAAPATTPAAAPSAVAAASAVVDEDDFANSPAMLAFKQAARDALSPIEGDDLALNLVETTATTTSTTTTTAAVPTDPEPLAAESEEESMVEAGEFAQAAVPNADFHKMFRSIMKSHRINNRRRNKKAGGAVLQH